MSESPMASEPLMDLLLERATAGLDAADSAQLERLLQAPPARRFAVEQTVAIEQTVAAVMLALDGHRDPLPAHVVERILEQGPRVRGAPRWRAGLGWWAAAACLGLALAGWWPRLFVGSGMAPAQMRAALLASPRVVRAEWTPGGAAPPGGLAGDVVFDPLTQRGYLRLRGIASNDPRAQQYQLWIADAARTQPEPVDGGVFNVDASALAAAGGEVLIPFAPHLPVRAPAAFVVTIEQPGGVVVSGQQRVLAIAKVQAG